MGRKAADFFKNRTYGVAHEEREIMSNLTPEEGPRLAQMCMKAFNTGQVSSVWVFYNRFINLIRKKRGEPALAER